MSKFVKKLIPFESCDIPAIQSWLEDMAEQGLFYVDCGFFCARFKKGEPKKLRSGSMTPSTRRMLPHGKNHAKPGLSRISCASMMTAVIFMCSTA